MQFLHFCQVECVPASPSLLHGGVCVQVLCFARVDVCLQCLHICPMGCVHGMQFLHFCQMVCGCGNFTFARLEVCLQSLHMCRTGCVHAVASHLLDWCVWVQSSHWGAHTRKHPHLQSGTSDRLAHPHTTWQKRNNCLHTPLGMCEVSTLAVWHK